MSLDPASRIQDLGVFGEFGGVNPSITDASTYTYLGPQALGDLIESGMDGCCLYSHHFDAINRQRCDAVAAADCRR